MKQKAFIHIYFLFRLIKFKNVFALCLIEIQAVFAFALIEAFYCFSLMYLLPNHIFCS